MDDLRQTIIEIFDGQGLQDQPQAIVHAGGGDGSALEQILEIIRARPLDLFDADQSGVDAALTAASSKHRTLVLLPHQYAVSAEACIILAAARGLFNDGPVKCFPQISLHDLRKRDYVVRHAIEEDLERLHELEKLCWRHTRTPKQQIRTRLEKYPQGQFVVEKAGEVLGVIYSQRITAVDELAKCDAASVHQLHDASGAIVQLLAVNIDPAAQASGYGDQLLEFMLQRCALVAGVTQVVGVTLCKNFDANGSEPFEQYIKRQGSDQDPVLAFHQAHGAAIVRAVPGYRPQDSANQANGVLVAYDIQNRVPRAQRAAAPGATALDPQQIARFVQDSVVQLLGSRASAFQLDRPLMEMGLDSADLLQLQQQLEDKLEQKFSAGFFFEHNSAKKVIAYLTAGRERAPINTARSPRAVTDIAIIGMSCKLPGGIETPDQLWQVLAAATSVIGRIPEGRGRWPASADMPAIDQGGFVREVEAFDASFFRISRAEATITDPQQRILLELAWACLEDSGTLPASLRGSNTGVFIGASNCDYSRLIQEAGLEVQAHHGVGSSLAILANRLSYFFDFSGPSLSIDTACSSSLVALHTAVQSLRAGECAAALVGGVNLICHPDLSIAYHKAGMLAPDGRCKAFDASANGYVRSEGAVMMLLKSLDRAIADQDQIHAVIKGSAINHGGLAGGLTVPNPQKQSELLQAAWKNAGISARQLTYIEAHGTGTSLGDPIEIQGIQAAFGDESSGHAARHCAIGSVKSNLGHLEPAAGITGLLKIVLCMQQQQLPASLHFSRLNPKIRLGDSPFYIQEQLGHWAAGQPRLAAVSSFGSGGANAHVVVEEFPRQAKSAPREASYLFVLSASDAERLRAYARQVLRWLESAADSQFADAIYTWQTGRTAKKQRLAIKVKDRLDLNQRLQQWLAGHDDSAAVWCGQANADPSGIARLWHAKPGQQLIQQALLERDLEQLGIIWTSGIEIDWRKLYGPAGSSHSGAPARISLPTYPFARERYWIDTPAGHAVAAKGAGAAVLHPLLHVNTSDLFNQTYRASFAGTEFFLADHQVNFDGHGARCVLPAVAYLEMARAAVEQALPARPDGTILTLQNTVWSQPFIVTEQKQISIVLAADDDEQLTYEMCSQGDKADIVHCEGRAVFSSEPAPARLDIERLRGQIQATKLDADRVYAALARMGLHYGPAHRAITALSKGERQLLAQLKLPAEVLHTQSEYLLHPSLTDGCLQAAIGLMIDLSSPPAKPSVPFALESLRIIAACSADMLAWVRFAAGSGPRDAVIKLDIDLCDTQGNVCAQMRGFSARALQGAPVHSAPTKGLQSFVPVWNPVRPEARSKVVFPESSNVLLLGSDPAQLEWLQQSHANAHLLQLPPAASIEVIHETLQFHSFDHLLWIAPDVAQACGAEIIDQQQDGVLTVFRIIKALLQLGYADKELSWTLITRETQRVTKHGAVRPAHAGVFGLIGSLAKEYPHWNLNLLDVDSLDAVTGKDCLSQPADKRGNGRAHRQGEWFQQQFAHAPALAQSSPVHYRQNGVYVVIGGAGGLGEVWSRFMIERYQARMVWIGREDLNATITAKIEALRAIGPAPLYVKADATQLDALQAARDTILATYPAIHGVVHSAIILQDKSLQLMEEPKFKAGLAAKVDISVNMDRVFGAQPLDFMLFFSSILSFIKSPGQSNYAAGCTFKDSFAHSLQRQRAYPVKIVNWGYWGKVGIVADDAYNKIMARMGLGSIEPQEGMAFLQTLISSELNQLALIKTVDTEAVTDIQFAEALAHYPKTAPAATSRALVAARQPAVPEGGLQTPAMDALLAEILAATLAAVGQPTKSYERWVASSFRYLEQRSLPHPHVRPLAEVWPEWEAKKSLWNSNPNLQAQVSLLDACLKALPAILAGKQLATTVMFPNASMRMVEGIYQGNALADYFNEVLRETLLACIEKRGAVRILEIGAGTGGTTAKLLPALEKFSVAEYCYTDVSKAFLMYAEEHYQPRFSALTTAIFDVSKPLASQSIATDHYDVVIATNVLHATPNIRETLRNAKAALRSQGVLLLNELSTWSLFTHLTFGLLEGWWLHEDSALRLPGSPALAPEQWQAVLTEEGFHSISFPASAAHPHGQQIIAAVSDGWVRQRLVKQAPPANAKAAQPVKAAEPVARLEDSLREKSIAWFQKLIAGTLKLQPHEIEPQRPFAEYGLDSILIGQLTYQLRKVFPDITSTLFFEVQSAGGLVDYFLSNKQAELTALLSAPTTAAASQQLPRAADQGIAEEHTTPRPLKKLRRQTVQMQPPSAATASVFDVAVVGMSGRYPRARNLKKFWENLSGGVDCIGEIPQDRWSWEEYFDEEKGKPGKIYTKWGGFLDGIDEFDPLFFKISPKEAKRMDPQERLFLECCYHAMEDAGYTPETLGRADQIGIFVGVMNSRYTPQPAHYSIANRVSYVFNFQGPSMAVDTACSASLTAVHLALESLYNGSSACAIAGGVNLIIDAVHYLELSELTMLSSGGQCKSFGEQADGFVDAEGVGAVVLKPLRQAELDGDHIYGVLKGSAVNAGGKTNGYTVPNPIAQAAVVSLALRRANVAAEQLSYIEAHGTGTALGDPIEIAGLTRAFKETSTSKQFCAIGSLKSNIGHCESAAGIAGLTKVLLQLQHGQLVPSLHASVTNAKIDFAQTPFKVQKSLEKWQRPLRKVNGTMQEAPRMAGVSSFGAGGSNAHVIVEEYQQRQDIAVEHTGPVIILLSARTPEQLQQKAHDLLDFIRTESAAPLDLAAMAYTLQVGREALDERCGLLVSSAEQLAAKLQAYLAGEQDIEETYQGQVKRNKETLALFSTDSDLQQTIDKWIEQRKLAKLLELWAKGLDLDWNKLYGASKPRRISLPTYPFAKERFWVDKPATGPVAEKATATAAAALHPLLHANTSELNEQRYSSIFTGEEFFLVDHQVSLDGGPPQKVLPGVACLEIARVALEHALPVRPESAVLELHDVVWGQPVVVARENPLSIALLATSDSQRVDYEIYSREGEAEIIHCQGRAVFSQQPAPARLDIEQLKSQMGRGKLEASTVYAAFNKRGLVYGPAHQTIATIHQGEQQLVAQLRLPEMLQKSRDAYWLHPSLIDGALQACIGLIEDGSPLSNQPRLPFALESLRIVWACAEEMVAWIRYSPGNYPESPAIKLDIDLCDERGNVCAQLRGISYPRASLDLAAQSPVALPPPAPREIAFGAYQQPAAAPVARKKPGNISLAAPGELATGQSLKRASIALSNAALERSVEEASAQGERTSLPSAVSLFDHGNGIFSIRIAAADGNLLTAGLIEQLSQALSTVQQAVVVKVLIISGTENGFLRGGREQYNEAVEKQLYTSIAAFPFPVIAVLQGDASGAGFLFGALCDFMICSEEACYSYLPPNVHEAALFKERFGEARAQDFLHAATRATGRQLRDKGWTCPILPQAQVEVYARSLAETLATKSQGALRLLKQHLARHVLRLVETLSPVAEHSADRGVAARPITATLQHVQLTTHAKNVLVVRIRATAAEPEELAAELSNAFSQVTRAAGYKAIVLGSEYPEFLARGPDRLPESTAWKFQRLALESPVPVVAVLSSNARGAAWFVSQCFDARVYNKEGRYSFDSAGLSVKLTKQAAVLFAERFGSSFAGEIVLSGAEYSGAELQQHAGAVTVTDAEQAWPVALKIAESWAALPWDTVTLWKAQTNAALREQLHDDLLAWPAGLEQHDEAPGLQFATPTPIALESKVITATAHPDGVLVIRMEERQAKNMFSEAFVAGIHEVFAHIEQTPAYKAVVLTGYDSYFASGGTQETLQAIQAGKAKFTDFKIFQLPMECQVPVIAAMQGHGIGGGWSLGMFADFILLSEESRYVSPYMNYGFTPGAGATLIFPRRMGYDLARESLLTAQQYAGSELKDRGLEIPVLPRNDVYPAAMALARKIARGSRSRLIGLKHQLTQPLRRQVEDTYRLELAMHEQTFVGQSETLEQIHGRFLQVGGGPELEAHTAVAPRLIEPAPALLSADSDALPEVAATLKKLLAQELHMQEEDVDENTQFVDLGMDSIVAVTWVRKINDKYQLGMEAPKVYSHPTLTQLSRFVKDEAEKRGTLSAKAAPVVAEVPVVRPARTSARRVTELPAKKLTSWRHRGAARLPVTASVAKALQPIAVVGMAGQFPQARNVEAFWENIAAGRNCISRIAADRWDIDAIYQQDGTAVGKTNCPWMGALEEYDLFDPLFFSISPTEAESMDPQQRLFLQACWHSIENAGYDAKSLSGSKCGVFVGCSGGDYHQLAPEQRLTAQGFTGGANSILAARISYFLNLQGPCLSIDTACSSSLVALAHACDSLIAGNSDLALAGGVAVMASPEMHVKTSQAGMLSPDGRCFTFDQRANGFVPGEAAGVVMLKRLADAERDRDLIYAVIQGWGVNQDGKTNGITAPNPESQTRLQQEVYDKFQIDPASIQLIEAHGTGTKLGDPIEIEGLKGSFARYTQKKGYCALGSVKSNVGHCLAAAGIVGFIKVILALSHKKLPPTINFDRLNEHINLQDTPFYINERLEDWQPQGTDTRRAAISAFGFSGTNAHVVMGEYLPPGGAKPPVTVITQKSHIIVPLSARTPEQLKQKAADLLEFMRTAQQALDLVEIAYTLQVGREAMEERVGFLVSSTSQLAEKLQTYLDGARDVDGIYQGQAKRSKERLSFLSQDADMRETVISRWLAQEKLSKLLDLWINGLDLDWNRLYGEAKPQRIRLPLYPFAKERYWLEAASEPVAAKAAAPVLNPLLHTNTSNFSEQSYCSTFSGEEFFLTDHRVRMDGRTVQKVLPGVAYLEMARAAVEQALPERTETAILELHNTVWLKPVVVTEPKRISIALVAGDVHERAGEPIDFEIYSEDHGEEQVHCQGRAVFSRKQTPARIGLASLKAQMTQRELDAAALYAMFDRMGLHYGAAHQGVRAIYLGDKQLLAQLRLPSSVEAGHADYVLHPSLLDSALQASIGLLVNLADPPGEPTVPFALESLRSIAACTAEMFAWVRHAQGSKPGDKLIRLNIDLCDRHGNVCVQMQGFAARILEPARHDAEVRIEVDSSFDSAFYQRIIENVMNDKVSAGDAADLG
jgi:acyl transferase domain-containing protein/enoyl-CoA hydratase/carnithine racemase/acyl carrier protein/SAM-dependent methyltransferase/ribosomal protein S18 acetylase RimI-like enzyme